MSKRLPSPTQLPSGNWRVRVMVDGKTYSVTEPTRELAMAKAMALRADAIQPERVDARKTLGEILDEYIENRENVLSPSTIRSYASYRKHRFLPYHNYKLPRLDRRTLQRMVNEEARLVAPKTLKNAWGLVQAALAEYEISTRGINLPPVPKSERPYLTHSEILQFCDAVRGKRCVIPALLALCSLRMSEILALDWKDINLKRSTISVRRSMVKGPYGYVEKQTNKTSASTRVVPIIVPQLRKALLEQPNKTGRVVTMSQAVIFSDINKVCREAGLPEIGCHGLRHSWCSLAHFLRIPALDAARMGGWADLGTMQKIYTHLSADDLADSAKILVDFFEKNG